VQNAAGQAAHQLRGNPTVRFRAIRERPPEIPGPKG
jgi:hypothetical protein